MIIRSFARRHGRAIQHRGTANREIRRCISSMSSDISSLDSSANSSIHTVQEIEALLNSVSKEAVPPIEVDFDDVEGGLSPTQLAAENYREFKRQESVFKKLGADTPQQYSPHALVNNPPSPSDITLELLLSSQSHLGHSTSLWNPSNSKYIFGIRDGIHIISLDATAAYLRRACKVVEAVTQKAGLVLFAGTRPGQHRSVVKAAELSGGCHLFEKWIPGSLTNGLQILGKCQMKVVDQFDNEVPGFEEQLLDQPPLKPDLVVCLNPLENYVLLHECALNNIPTIGVIDTDANPTWVTYPIPANDDSLRCTNIISGVLGRAGESGKLHRLALAAAKKITFQPASTLKTPGHLDKATSSSQFGEEKIVKLGGTIQELEEQDRGIQYDYKMAGDIPPVPKGLLWGKKRFAKMVEGMELGEGDMEGMMGVERDGEDEEGDGDGVDASVERAVASPLGIKKALLERVRKARLNSSSNANSPGGGAW